MPAIKTAKDCLCRTVERLAHADAQLRFVLDPVFLPGNPKEPGGGLKAGGQERLQDSRTMPLGHVGPSVCIRAGASHKEPRPGSFTEDVQWSERRGARHVGVPGKTGQPVRFAFRRNNELLCACVPHLGILTRKTDLPFT